MLYSEHKADIEAIKLYTDLKDSLARELGELTPTRIHENFLHQVTFFVKDTHMELY